MKFHKKGKSGLANLIRIRGKVNAGLEESMRNNLSCILHDLEKEADNFVMSQGKDFTRKRKLSFSETMYSILSMEGNSLDKELCDIYNSKSEKPFVSKSAFVQRRNRYDMKPLK